MYCSTSCFESPISVGPSRLPVHSTRRIEVSKYFIWYCSAELVAGVLVASPTLYPPWSLFCESKSRLPVFRLVFASLTRLFEPRGVCMKTSARATKVNKERRTTATTLDRGGMCGSSTSACDQ
eukprot:Amastigsp_a182190_184.p3 type:complete len:123 gc:universal Amastigsp_a182190_184:384-16(-)